jgi:hypothetical protein
MSMMNFDIVEGTQYSCESDKRSLQVKKSILDYHTKNIASITPAKLKILQLDYETSKKKFDNSPCGKDPETDACVALQAKITSTQSTIAYFRTVKDNKQANLIAKHLEDDVKKFNDSKCAEKVSGYRAGAILSISENFQALDKLRIEEESKYQLKQKIFFGAIVLMGAVLIITTFGKRE